MKLKLIRHLWGVDLSHGLDPYEKRWRDLGYSGLETSLRLVPDRETFLAFLKRTGMDWVPQVFSTRADSSNTVLQHLDSLRTQIEETLPYNPLFINAHSGADLWTTSQAEDYHFAALEMEKEYGIVIAHETHRGRCMATPWMTRHLLEKLPGLKLTCDLSHWVCVCERLLPDMDDTLALVARHTHHVHARVGHPQGPQVPDPSAPEYASQLAAHESWWDLMWNSQSERGMAVSTLTPEFGPPPYMPILPHTGMPVADLATVCDWMALRQMNRFSMRGKDGPVS